MKPTYLKQVTELYVIEDESVRSVLEQKRHRKQNTFIIKHLLGLILVKNHLVLY